MFAHRKTSSASLSSLRSLPQTSRALLAHAEICQNPLARFVQPEIHSRHVNPAKSERPEFQAKF